MVSGYEGKFQGPGCTWLLLAKFAGVTSRSNRSGASEGMARISIPVVPSCSRCHQVPFSVATN